MEPREVEIDSLLRRSLGGPVPSLSPDFDERLMVEVSGLGRYGRMLLAGYAVVSALASAVIMRDQGLGWPTTVMMILVPLAVVGVVPALRRAVRPAVRQGAV